MFTALIKDYLKNTNELNKSSNFDDCIAKEIIPTSINLNINKMINNAKENAVGESKKELKYKSDLSNDSDFVESVNIKKNQILSKPRNRLLEDTFIYVIFPFPFQFGMKFTMKRNRNWYPNYIIFI